MTPIGKGRQGIVFTATQPSGNKSRFAVKVAPRDLAASKRGEPQPVDVEFKIHDAVQNYTPNVVRIYKSMRCENFITPAQMNMPNVQNSSHYDKSKQGIILMELATGGSLDSWMKKRASVDDAVMAHIISDILTALFKIQSKEPDFRHNDLHMQNIFVADRGFIIGDFGWARLKKSGTNPAVNTANGTKTSAFWGVGPKTDERYDHHLFLNELLFWTQKHAPADHPKAIEFLKMAVPPGYRGAKDAHISEWRLKYEDPCPGLPSLSQLLSHPFLTGKKRATSPNLKAAKAKLKPVKVKRISSVNLLKAKAKLKPANRRKPGRLITSLRLQQAKAKLRRVPRPKPKPRITGYNLRAAKAKLRKVVARAAATPKKAVNYTARKSTKSNVGVVLEKRKRVPIPREVLRSNKFNRLVEKIRANQGGPVNESYNNARYRARMKAINQIEKRINRGLAAFSPSPPKLMNKLPPPLSPLGPPKPKPKVPSPPKPKPKVPSPPKPKPAPKKSNLGLLLSPSSKRVKIRAPNSGRVVYANGAVISLQYLKNSAARYGVDIKGLRSKADIARKLFNSL
jgi:serine/threonine protein kinase